MSEAPVKFWSTIRKRIIIGSAMDRETRLTFITGGAVVAGAILLNLFDLGDGGPSVETVVGRLPILTLIFLALGELVVTFLLFTGISLMRGWLRYAVLAVVTLPPFALYALSGNLVGSSLLLPALGLAVVSWWADRNDWTPRLRWRACAALSVATLLLAALFLAVGMQPTILSVIWFQTVFAQFGLFMASTDLAELAEIGSEAIGSRVLASVQRPQWRLVVTLLLVVANLVITANALIGVAPYELGAATGAGLDLALCCGLTLWLLVTSARHLGAVEPHIAYSSLFAIVAVAFVALLGGAIWQGVTTESDQKFFGSVQSGDVFLGIFLSALALFLTLGRRSANLFSPLALSVVIGIFWFAHYIYHGTSIAYFGFAVAIGTLLLLSVGRLFRVLRVNLSVLYALLAELNLSAIMFSLLFLGLFFPLEKEGEHFSFWQAAFVLLALAWDIVSSGHVTVGADSKRLPRLARVCIFVAYVISVALLVMLSRSMETTSPHSAVFFKFDSEELVGFGLGLLGAPFFFFIFALRLRAVLTPTLAANAATKAAARHSSEGTPVDTATGQS